MSSCHSLTAYLTAIVLLFSYLSLLPSTYAQTFTPVGAVAPYYNFVENQALYIGGGATKMGSALSLAQAFRIDLSVPWNTSNPKFDSLPDGPAISNSPSVISSDGKQWMVFYDTKTAVFDIQTKSWKPTFDIPDIHIGAATGVVDPDTGVVYIPNAMWSYMVVMDVKASTYSKVEMPQALLASQFPGVAWSASLRKLLLFGGTTGGGGRTDFFNAFSYSPAEGWRNISMNMKGDVPRPLSRSCLVPAYRGTKMILFGGSNSLRGSDPRGDNPPIYSGDLFVLDVATMTWKKAPPNPTNSGFILTACAVSNDHFIAWGGLLERDTVVSSTFVYNVKTNKWTTIYTPAPPAPSQSPTSPPTVAEDFSGPFSQATDVVAVVFGMIALVLIVWYLLLRRKTILERLQNAVSKPRDPEGSISGSDDRSRDGKKPDTSDRFDRNPQKPYTSDVFLLEGEAPRNPHQWIMQLPPPQYPQSMERPTINTSLPPPVTS